jgi:type II secretory pathway pseudopilin PulG
MIDTNPLRRWRAPTGLLGRIRARRGGHAAEAGAPRRGGFAAEDGITLIEVMASALMVGFIAIATFNGFDVATGATAQERFHDQAALLAAQSQELLRSDSAATLDPLQQAAHVYTQTIGGQKYTITQSDRWISDTNQNASCSATGKEHSSQSGSYLQVHTMVTWSQQEATGEHALEQYSIITPPDGSGLEVDVLNGRTPELPVSGVTVVAGEAESTTGEAGCVIFGGIPATRINVEAFKVGDVVTPTDTIRKVFHEVLVAPNITTHVEAKLNQGAAITTEFTHEGKPATGDTFVAYNSQLEPAPNLELGSTRFGTFGKEGEYDALPGTTEAGSYKEKATTPISSTYYPTGDLFPFQGAWVVYAGDCLENNPETVDKTEFPANSDPSVTPEPGQDATVKVPTSEVMLEVYNKTTKIVGGGGLASTIFPVKITNSGCTAKTPDNASTFSAIHIQSTTVAGHLEAPYQPFGKSFKMCLYDSTLKKTYTTTYANEKILGPTIGIYLEEPTGKSYSDGNGHTVEVQLAPMTNTC